MNIRAIAGAAVAALAGLLASCGGDGISGTGVSDGSLRVALTDAPGCGYDAVNVTVQKVRVHQSSSAGDNDGGWSEIVLAPALRVDLLSLTNGVLAELGETPLPAGRYTQLRLVLAANSAAAPLANSVVPTGGAETALDTPSAAQSGLKLNVDIDVPADKRADIILDFDACKSVVKRGNSGAYNLKPVISVIPRLSDAGLRIVGHVAPAAAASGVSVSAQQDGVPVKATVADATGLFVLYPVPAGSVDLLITSAGRAHLVLTAVPVTTTSITQVNTAATAFAPPLLVQAPRVVDGTLTPATATVRATQQLTAGPKLEIAWAGVDAATGAFSFALPIDAPLRALHAAPPAVPAFAPDAAAAGLYVLEATSAGALQLQAIDANAAVAPIIFAFP